MLLLFIPTAAFSTRTWDSGITGVDRRFVHLVKMVQDNNIHSGISIVCVSTQNHLCKEIEDLVKYYFIKKQNLES